MSVWMVKPSAGYLTGIISLEIQGSNKDLKEDKNDDSDDSRPFWQCLSCKNLNEDWDPFCPACDEFASLVWQRPSGATPI